MPAPPRIPAARTITYDIGDGWQAIVGRTDEDNEIVTFRLARPNDLWLHVRGFAGSHVIVPVRGKEEPGREVVRRAAAIAAWHSKAKNAGQVAVSVTRAKFVSKPRGAKTGTVRIRREKTVTVRPGLPSSTARPGP